MKLLSIFVAMILTNYANELDKAYEDEVDQIVANLQ